MIGWNRDDVWLGLDVGGTKIAGGMVAFPGAVLLARQQIPTQPTRPARAILRDCIELVHALQRAAPYPIRGIGIGVAELVDLQGSITSAATLPWKDFDLAGEFSRFATTFVEADVRAAALAEAQYGAGRAYTTFAYLSVGTGISACLVRDGVPYAGARGNALILGTSKLMSDARGEFLLEGVASGAALVDRYNRLSETRVSSGKEVMRAMENGDLNAQKIVHAAGDALGLGIALYVNLLDPEAVVIGGGLGCAEGVYWDRAVSSARALVYADNARELPILHAALGVDAGVIGAAAVARDHLEPLTK